MRTLVELSPNHLRIMVPALLVVLAEVVLGATQAGLGLQRRAFLRMAWGGALALAGLVSLAAAAGLALDWLGGEWHPLVFTLAVLAAPVLVVPAGALVLGSGATLLGALRRPALEASGFTQLPGTAATWAAAALLVVAVATFADTVVRPAWQLRPYSDLAALGEAHATTLQGWRAEDPNAAFDDICVIRWPEGSPWRADFSLSLDWRGRIVVTTRRSDDARSGREHHLPFESSEYSLRDGALARTR